MESRYLIRNAKLSDYSEIAKLDKLLNSDHMSQRSDIIRQDISFITLEQFSTFMSSNNKIIIVAEINGEIIGFLLAKRCNYHNHAAIRNMSVIEIEKIYVNPLHRHMRVGTALFTKMVDIAKSCSIKKIELTVWSWNKDAIEFYHKLGLYDRYRRLEFDL